jgi:putative transposase
MNAAIDLAPLVGIVAVCAALAISRATMYRRLARVPSCALPRPPPARGLSRAEKQDVLDVLHSERFVDVAPAEVVNTLLDEDGTWLCSPRTMYRVLDENAEVRERRDQLRHPAYAKPELLATGPNQVWSWDITKLLGAEKWQYFCLYVLLDSCAHHVMWSCYPEFPPSLQFQVPS